MTAHTIRTQPTRDMAQKELQLHRLKMQNKLKPLQDALRDIKNVIDRFKITKKGKSAYSSENDFLQFIHDQLAAEAVDPTKQNLQQLKNSTLNDDRLSSLLTIAKVAHTLAVRTTKKDYDNAWFCKDPRGGFFYGGSKFFLSAVTDKMVNDNFRIEKNDLELFRDYFKEQVNKAREQNWKFGEMDPDKKLAEVDELLNAMSFKQEASMNP